MSHGGKSMCHHPFLFAHLPLSYLTTTLKVLLISWGNYCWGVECGRTVNPCPHAHSTNRLTLSMIEKPLSHHSKRILHYSIFLHDCMGHSSTLPSLHVSTSNSCACQLMELCFKIVCHPTQQTLKK